MPGNDRSPNYPRFSLPTAIESAEILYKKEGMSELPTEVAAKAIGYESANGAARAKIASMKQYGLLDGRGDKLHLTDLAFRILQSPDSNDVASARAEAGSNPPLFAEIKATKQGASEEAIAYWLRRERRFSDEGARLAVKAYKETVAILGLAQGRYNEGNGEQQSPVGKSNEKRLDIQKPAPSSANRHNVTGLLLEGGTIADVGFSGDPLTREGVDMLIDYFKLLRRALPPLSRAEPPTVSESDD